MAAVFLRCSPECGPPSNERLFKKHAAVRLKGKEPIHGFTVRELKIERRSFKFGLIRPYHLSHRLVPKTTTKVPILSQNWSFLA